MTLVLTDPAPDTGPVRAESRDAALQRQRTITRFAGLSLVWLCVFSSGFVLREPAPFDLMMVPLIAGGFLIGGLRFYPQQAPGFILMILFIAGGLISMTQATVFGHVPLYMAVSAFLVGTYMFFASLIAGDVRTIRVLRTAYIASAVVVALIGILGYFHAIPGSESFTLYNRAKGTFEDPNVFGPFLIFPIGLLVHDFLTEPLRRTIRFVPFLLILLFGVFLSFSRAAWGMTLFTCLSLTLIVFLKDPRPVVRLRIIGIATAGAVLLVVGLGVALSFDAVSDLFAERAKLVQPYDSARYGRFARYSHGFAMAFEAPLGIGPMQFRNYFPEDPHNIYMKSLLDYGWLGGFSYIAFTLWTLVRGFPLLFRGREWSPFYRAAYVVFVAHVLCGIIIDTDHWRHLFMLYGFVWGCFALAARERAAGQAMPQKAPS